MAKRNNEWIRRELEQRTRLENRIRELGGELPQRWPWDDTGELRNLQLMELVEELERSTNAQNKTK